MNSSKVKTVLIFLLAAVDIFMLINVFTARFSKNSLSNDTLKAYAQALERRDIYVDPQDIPAQKYTQDVIAANSSHDTRLSSAQALLGEIVAEYSLPDGITYQSDNAYVSFFGSGRFEYGLLEDESVASISTAPSGKLKRVQNGTAKKLKSLFNKLTSSMSSQNPDFKMLGQQEIGGFTAVYAQLTINELHVFGGDFVAVFGKENLIYLSGKYLFDIFTASYTMEYIDAPNALFLLDKGDVSVDNMQMIYYPVKVNDNEYFIIPSWQITADDGSIKIFDGVSGYERQ